MYLMYYKHMGFGVMMLHREHNGLNQTLHAPWICSSLAGFLASFEANEGVLHMHWCQRMPIKGATACMAFSGKSKVQHQIGAL